MQTKLIILGASFVLLTACGSSSDDKIVMKDTHGTSKTYKEVVEFASNPDFASEVTDCAEFAAVTGRTEGTTFPAGQAEFVKACEEGRKKAGKG